MIIIIALTSYFRLFRYALHIFIQRIEYRNENRRHREGQSERRFAARESTSIPCVYQATACPILIYLYVLVRASMRCHMCLPSHTILLTMCSYSTYTWYVSTHKWTSNTLITWKISIWTYVLCTVEWVYARTYTLQTYLLCIFITFIYALQ